METRPRKPYPTDCTDDEWDFVAPCLALMRPGAPQRVHDPREVYDALRRIVRAGAPVRLLPIDRDRGVVGHGRGPTPTRPCRPPSPITSTTPTRSDRLRA